MFGEILAWVKNVIRSWAISCIFAGMVGWERLRRYALRLRHRSQRLLNTWSGGDSDDANIRPLFTGKSAPSLDDDPVSMPRPLSQRIIGAWLLHASDSKEKLQPCTDEFKRFIDNQNLWLREDMFFNQLKAFSPPDQESDDTDGRQRRLLVLFKNGMRKFAVVYKQAIVFPPAVTRGPSGPSTSVPLVSVPLVSVPLASVPDGMEAWLWNKHPAKSETLHVGRISGSEALKQLAGPAGDYYVGSCYESTVNDLARCAWAMSFADNVHFTLLTEQFSSIQIIISTNEPETGARSKTEEFNVNDLQSLHDYIRSTLDDMKFWHPSIISMGYGMKEIRTNDKIVKADGEQ